MISCLTFKRRLNDYIDGSITDDLKASMDKHIQNCKNCKMLYEEELQVENAFKDVLNIRNIKFNSSRDEIIKNIDKNRYSKNFSNKLYYRLRKNIVVYAASVILFFSIISGSLYAYGLYTNTSNKPVSIEEDYKLVENIKKNSKNDIIEPKVDTSKNNLIEAELPLPKSSNNKAVQNILNKINNEPLGSSPWFFGYVDNKKVIFYNHSALLAYSYNNGNPTYYTGIDLEEIDGGYIQGAIHTDLNFSPNGDYVVINNGALDANLQNNRYSMYFFNLSNGESKLISNENKDLLIDTWSSTSSFYAFGDRNGERVFVHDIQSGTSRIIPFNKGIINSIFISDYGDIIIESSLNLKGQTTFQKYILRKDNSYVPEEYFIPGAIIGMRENRVLYYDQTTIYELISGISSPIKELESGFNIQKLEKRYASFTDGTCTYVYDYNKSFYKYNTSNTKDYEFVLSPDLKKSAMLKNNAAKIMFSNTIQDEIEIGYYGDLSSSYIWFGNNSLIRISQKNGSTKLGDFVLYKANIEPNNAKITPVSNIDSNFIEQYAPGILIDNSQASSLEKANIILVNYLEYLKSETDQDSLKIKDYKIKKIRIEKQTQDGLLFSVEYSVLPYSNKTQVLGVIKDNDGWYNNIIKSISTFSMDNIYYINKISSQI